ncbi:helix-turn-helix domain-containing protein [Nonomuraea rubra]|uniref:helix-turn-helix domain-containing protein n=1 Tax=Nonomuraea rubra TaxID=46180 RepID=UPI0033FA50D9
MCRSQEQGGRRCPGGHSSSRTAQAARQRLCRARKALVAAEAASSQAGAAAAPAGIVEARVRVAFDAAMKNRPDHGWDGEHWMSLAKLRKQMPDVPRADLDAVLDRMLVGKQVRLMAELNQKTLTQEDHAAAIDIGPEPRHLISVHPDPAASAQAALAVAKQRVKDAEADVTSLKQDAQQNCSSRSSAMGDHPSQTAASAAADLGVSINTLYKWLKTGEIRKHGVTGHKDERGRWVITLLEDAPGAASGVEAQIRAAYARLAARPGAWVSLTELRSQVDAPAHLVDAVLRDLERRPDVNLVPESNQKTLTQQDRDAAVVIGGQDKHLLWMGD